MITSRPSSWIILVIVSSLLAPGLARATTTFTSTRTESPIVLDGLLDDPVWQTAEVFSGFTTSSPDFGHDAAEETIVQLAHDSEALYFAIRAFDREPHRIKSALMAWDELFAGDYVGVYVDALNDSQGAWHFYVNPHGSQADRLYGSEGEGDTAPDNVWMAAATRDSLGYVVEITVPLRSLRFTAGDVVTMGVMFDRHISRGTEYSNLPPFRTFGGTRMSQFGRVDYDDLAWKRTWELLPSVVVADRQARQGDELETVDDLSGTEVGLTGKIGLTPTLTLDLAANPDFSQVESDAGQVDLNLRSLVYYPEKRPFFQEGSDYFVMGGTGASAFAAVLHTRNIIDPLAGARVTGKAGSANVVGVLYAEDEAPGVLDGSGDRAQYATARYKRQFGDQSFAGGIYTARRYAGRTNQVAGVDGQWRVSDSTTLQGNGLLSTTEESSVDTGPTKHHVAGEWLYRTRDWFLRVRAHDISEDFDLDTGFLPRDGVSYFQPSARRLFYPGEFLKNINMGYWGYTLHDKYEDAQEDWHNFFVWLTMPRSSTIGLWKFFGNEVWSGGDFDADGWYATGWSQVTRSLRLAAEYRSEGEPRFNSHDPYQGDQKTSAFGVTFEPGPVLKLGADLGRQVFDRRDTGERIFIDTVVRGKATIQLSRYFFIRAIADYRQTDFTGEPLEKKLSGEFLVSFNYLPGTVLYAGYGSLWETGATVPPEMNPRGVDEMLETQRSLFFKASYNWRI